MADPFPVDPPEPKTEAPASEVPHDDVHAALSDALGVTVETVDPNDKPLSRPFTEILAESKAKEQRTQTAAPFDHDHDELTHVETDLPLAARGRVMASDLPGLNVPGNGAWSAGLDNKTLPRDPNVTPRPGSVFGWDFAKDNAEAQANTGQGSLFTGENPDPSASGAASPGPGPFADRARISQRLKRLVRSEVLTEIEGEGLDQLAQIVARILTTHDAANARAAWNELGRLCDDVAEALR